MTGSVPIRASGSGHQDFTTAAVIGLVVQAWGTSVRPQRTDKEERLIEIWLNGKKVSMLTQAAWGKEPAAGQKYTYLGHTYTVTEVTKDPKTKFLKVILGS